MKYILLVLTFLLLWNITNVSLKLVQTILVNWIPLVQEDFMQVTNICNYQYALLLIKMAWFSSPYATEQHMRLSDMRLSDMVCISSQDMVYIDTDHQHTKCTVLPFSIGHIWIQGALFKTKIWQSELLCLSPQMCPRSWKYYTLYCWR